MLLNTLMVELVRFSTAVFRLVFRVPLSAISILILALLLRAFWKTVEALDAGTVMVLSSPLVLSLVVLPEQPASIETAITPARAREAIFLSFIVNFPPYGV